MRNWRTARGFPGVSRWLVRTGRGPTDLVGVTPVRGPDGRKNWWAYRVIFDLSDMVEGHGSVGRGINLIARRCSFGLAGLSLIISHKIGNEICMLLIIFSRCL